MRGVEGEGAGVAEKPGPVRDLGESGDAAAAENAHFNASRYAFFGKGIVEEVELGGLEDEIDNEKEEKSLQKVQDKQASKSD